MDVPRTRGNKVNRHSILYGTCQHRLALNYKPTQNNLPGFLLEEDSEEVSVTNMLVAAATHRYRP